MTETPTLSPESTALLVMDYQNGVVPMIAGMDAMLARAAEVIARLRAAGGHVAYVRVGFTEEEIAAMPETSGMRAAIAARGAAMHADAPHTQVHETVAPQAGDIVVRKTRVGPFLTTDLDAQLRGRGIDTLVLAGISTSGVVLSTVPDAYDRDYRLIVLSDLVADPDPEVHRHLIEHVFPKRARVITSEELEAQLDA
jgi:nicotinamidase-related amidase